MEQFPRTSSPTPPKPGPPCIRDGQRITGYSQRSVALRTDLWISFSGVKGWLLLQYPTTGEEVQEQAEGLDVNLSSNLASFYDLNITAVQAGIQPGKEDMDFWIVFAQEGVFRLYLREKTETTLTLLKVWEDLQDHGFSRLAALRPSVTGDIAVTFDNRLAYLTEEPEGRPGELAVQADAVEIGRCLGELHVLSQDLLPSWQDILRHYRPVESSLTALREDLELFRTMAEHRLYPTGFDLLFLKIYDEAAGIADQSLALLAEFPLDQLDNEPCWSGLLLRDCHGRTFRVKDDGTPRLPYLDRITGGLCVRDLVTLLDNVGEYTNWSVALATRVLDAYRGERCLYQEEIELMYGLGIFPRKVWEVGYEYYKGRRNQSEPAAAETLRQEWEKMAKRREYWRLLLGDELGYENRH